MRTRRFVTHVLAAVVMLSASSQALAQKKADAIDALLTKYHDFGLFNGSVLVAHDGEVIYKNGFGEANMEWDIPNTPDTKFRIGSVTKQFTSALILQLVEEGKISVDDPITAYLTHYPAEQGDRVTIHHLLTHTSGIPSYTGMSSLRTLERDSFEPDSFLSTFSMKELEFEPGSEWRYNNSGFYILGAIIEKVTGQPYDEALRAGILEPMGLDDTGYDHYGDVIEKRASGYNRVGNDFERAAFLDSSIPYAAGMMYSTVEDLFEWDQKLYGNGPFKSAETKERWFGPHFDLPGDEKGGYGYGWFAREAKIGDVTVDVIEHGGGIYGFTTGFWRIPADRNTIIVMDNTGGGQVGSIVRGIAAVLYDQPVPDPKRPIADVMRRTISQDGIVRAVEHYLDLKAASPDAFDFSEPQLNMLGYEFLRDGDGDTAIEIFKLNVEAYPEAYNTYDSLGEAYMEAGDDEKAIANYRKALELNPGSQNARDMLKKLGVDVEEASIELAEEQLESYVGKFALQPNFVLSVTREGDQLYAQATGQPRAEIYPSAVDKFFLKVVDAQLTFVRDDEGKVASLILHQNGQNMPAQRVE